MTNAVQTEATILAKKERRATKARQPRAATFRVTSKQGNKRIFTPVNKRAKRYAAIAGTELTLKNLRAIKNLGIRVLESPSLKKIV